MNLTAIQYKYINSSHLSNFKGGFKNVMQTNSQDKFNIATINATALLALKAEREMPENGKFANVSLAFEIPNSQNIAHFTIECDNENFKDTRRLSIGTSRKGSDRLTSIQLSKGTKKEILNYLNNKDNIELIKKALFETSSSIDEYFSTH